MGKNKEKLKTSKKAAIKIVAKLLEEYLNEGMERHDYDTGVEYQKALEWRAERILDDIEF